MSLDPFVGGLAIGAVATMLTILAGSYRMKRMADAYEMRIRSRDTRIQLLINQLEQYKHAEEQREKAIKREHCLRQTREPLR